MKFYTIYKHNYVNLDTHAIFHTKNSTKHCNRMGVGEEGRERDIEKVWTYIQGVNSGYL